MRSNTDRRRFVPTRESVERRQEMRGYYYDPMFSERLKVFRAKKGINSVRFLPSYEDDAKHFGIDLFIHRNVGPDNGAYLCPARHKVGPCPICELRRQLDDEGDSDAAKEILPRQSVAYWIINRDDDESGPQVFYWGYTLDQDLSAAMYDRKSGRAIDITAEEDGYDISFRRGDDKPFPKTTGIQADRQSSPISDYEDEQAEWIEFLQNEDNWLSNNLVFYDYDYLYKVLHGNQGKKQAGDADQEPERVRTRRTRNDERQGDDDGDADTRPRRRNRGGDDDGDADDQRPHRSSRGREPDPEDDAPQTRARDQDGDRPRRRSLPDDDPPPRRARERTDEQPTEPPRRQRTRLNEELDDDIPSKRRSGDEDERPARRRQSNGAASDEDKPARSRQANGDDGDGGGSDTVTQARRQLGRLRDEQGDDPPPRRRAPADDPAPPRRRR